MQAPLLSPAVAEQCQPHAEAIRVLGKRVAHDIIEIGTRLIEVKKALPRGTWLPWIEPVLCSNGHHSLREESCGRRYYRNQPGPGGFLTLWW